MRLPDFFIAGHPKCGTTALYEMLRRRADIFMPALKEPGYFAPEFHSIRRSRSGRPETIEAYAALFAEAAPGQLAGEATPSYLRSPSAPARIAELVPQARIVALLREPVSFLRSVHGQYVQDHVEDQNDLRRALELEPERRAGRALPPHSGRPQVLLYSDMVRYTEQLERFRASFPAEQMLILIYDDFRADNEGTLRRVLGFLGADESGPVDVLEANPSVRVRSQRLNALVRSAYLGRGVGGRSMKIAVKALTPRSARRAALRTTRSRLIYGEARAPDEGLARELRERFKPEVVALGQYLGRDLVNLWGYERVG